jgi:hypothetical protein
MWRRDTRGVKTLIQMITPLTTWKLAIHRRHAYLLQSIMKQSCKQGATRLLLVKIESIQILKCNLLTPGYAPETLRRSLTESQIVPPAKIDAWKICFFLCVTFSLDGIGGCSKTVEPVAAEAPSCRIPPDLCPPIWGNTTSNMIDWLIDWFKHKYQVPNIIYIFM